MGFVSSHHPSFGVVFEFGDLGLFFVFGGGLGLWGFFVTFTLLNGDNFCNTLSLYL